MYWLNPLHYALEGINSAMFHQDTTSITLSNQMVTSAEAFVKDYVYTTWSYGHIGYDVLALFLFSFLSL
jgi:hypothetical protein